MPRAKKDFEPARLGVFATPGSLLTLLNRGIRIEDGNTGKLVNSKIQYPPIPLLL